MYEIKIPDLQARVFPCDATGKGDFGVAIVNEEDNVLEYAIFSNEDDAESAAYFVSDFIQACFNSKRRQQIKFKDMVTAIENHKEILNED